MTTYQLNDSKMFMDIADGIAIVINSETGIYYGFNAFGTAVLEALSQGADPESVLQALGDLEKAPTDIKDRFDTFMKDLIKEEILVEGPAQNIAVTLSADAAGEDQFELSLKSYADAQEMLLADPIHEVKEETGWTPEKESIGYSKEETKEREKKVES